VVAIPLFGTGATRGGRSALPYSNRCGTVAQGGALLGRACEIRGRALAVAKLQVGKPRFSRAHSVIFLPIAEAFW